MCGKSNNCGGIARGRNDTSCRVQTGSHRCRGHSWRLGQVVGRLTVKVAKSIIRFMKSPRRGRCGLVVFLVLLFAGLSFNAYACLIPLFGTPATSMRNGCPTSEEPPVREFCDAFKTLTVPNSSDSYVASDDQAFYPDASAFSFQLLNLPATNRLTYYHPDHAPPRDVLLKTTVLRL